MQRLAKFPGKHEALSVRDLVKIRIKAPSFYKETFNSWSPKVYTITSIDETAPEGATYQLEGYPRSLLRYELKKIEDVHRVAQGQLQSALHLVRHAHAPAAAPIVPAAPAAAPAAVPAAVPAALPVAAPRIRRAVVIPPRPLTRSVTRAQKEAAA